MDPRADGATAADRQEAGSAADGQPPNPKRAVRITKVVSRSASAGGGAGNPPGKSPLVKAVRTARKDVAKVPPKRPSAAAAATASSTSSTPPPPSPPHPHPHPPGRVEEEEGAVCFPPAVSAFSIDLTEETPGLIDAGNYHQHTLLDSPVLAACPDPEAPPDIEDEMAGLTQACPAQEGGNPATPGLIDAGNYHQHTILDSPVLAARPDPEAPPDIGDEMAGITHRGAPGIPTPGLIDAGNYHQRTLLDSPVLAARPDPEAPPDIGEEMAGLAEGSNPATPAAQQSPQGYLHIHHHHRHPLPESSSGSCSVSADTERQEGLLRSPLLTPQHDPANPPYLEMEYDLLCAERRVPDCLADAAAAFAGTGGGAALEKASVEIHRPGGGGASGGPPPGVHSTSPSSLKITTVLRYTDGEQAEVSVRRTLFDVAFLLDRAVRYFPQWPLPPSRLHTLLPAASGGPPQLDPLEGPQMEAVRLSPEEGDFGLAPPTPAFLYYQAEAVVLSGFFGRSCGGLHRHIRCAGSRSCLLYSDEGGGGGGGVADFPQRGRAVCAPCRDLLSSHADLTEVARICASLLRLSIERYSRGYASSSSACNPPSTHHPHGGGSAPTPPPDPHAAKLSQELSRIWDFFVNTSPQAAAAPPPAARGVAQRGGGLGGAPPPPSSGASAADTPAPASLPAALGWAKSLLWGGDGGGGGGGGGKSPAASATPTSGGSSGAEVTGGVGVGVSASFARLAAWGAQANAQANAALAEVVGGVVHPGGILRGATEGQASQVASLGEVMRAEAGKKERVAASATEQLRGVSGAASAARTHARRLQRIPEAISSVSIAFAEVGVVAGGGAAASTASTAPSASTSTSPEKPAFEWRPSRGAYVTLACRRSSSSSDPSFTEFTAGGAVGLLDDEIPSAEAAHGCGLAWRDVVGKGNLDTASTPTPTTREVVHIAGVFRSAGQRLIHAMRGREQFGEPHQTPPSLPASPTPGLPLLASAVLQQVGSTLDRTPDAPPSDKPAEAVAATQHPSPHSGSEEYVWGSATPQPDDRRGTLGEALGEECSALCSGIASASRVMGAPGGRRVVGAVRGLRIVEGSSEGLVACCGRASSLGEGLQAAFDTEVRCGGGVAEEATLGSLKKITNICADAQAAGFAVAEEHTEARGELREGLSRFARGFVEAQVADLSEEIALWESALSDIGVSGDRVLSATDDGGGVEVEEEEGVAAPGGAAAGDDVCGALADAAELLGTTRSSWAAELVSPLFPEGGDECSTHRTFRSSFASPRVDLFGDSIE